MARVYLVHRTILVENIPLLELFGVNNERFNAIQRHFPDLHIVARGAQILVQGVPSRIHELEATLLALEDVYARFQGVDDLHFDQVLGDPTPESSAPTNEELQVDKVIVYGASGSRISPRTAHQRAVVAAEQNHDIVFTIGPAGTGKTYTAIALAVRALRQRKIRRIILTRPAVEAGERLGFLPGDLKDKLDPYLQPLYDALNDMMPASTLQNLLHEGTIQISPLAYMRGRTLDNAYIILDEAQNATVPQLKMFLTRLGRNAKAILTGDLTQIDLPDPSKSGLRKCINFLAPIEGIAVIEMDVHDIVRHRLVADIVDAFRNWELAHEKVPEKELTEKSKEHHE